MPIITVDNSVDNLWKVFYTKAEGKLVPFIKIKGEYEGEIITAAAQQKVVRLTGKKFVNRESKNISAKSPLYD